MKCFRQSNILLESKFLMKKSDFEQFKYTTLLHILSWLDRMKYGKIFSANIIQFLAICNKIKMKIQMEKFRYFWIRNHKFELILCSISLSKCRISEEIVEGRKSIHLIHCVVCKLFSKKHKNETSHFFFLAFAFFSRLI